MAGNGGGQGTTQQAQPQGFAAQYMNAVNPSSQAQPAGSFYTPNVGWNQQSAVDKLGTTGLGADIRGLASGSLQPAYNFSKNAGAGGQPSSGPMQGQMAAQATAPVTGAIGGAISGAGNAMGGAQSQPFGQQYAQNPAYGQQLQQSYMPFGFGQQAPMAMPWMSWGGQSPMGGLAPWMGSAGGYGGNPFLQYALGQMMMQRPW